MRTRIVLAIISLAVGLCFVPTLGYGKVYVPTDDREMRIEFLEAKVEYIMRNPTAFLDVDFSYVDLPIFRPPELPKSVDTVGKIVIKVRDTRNVFSYKSEIALLDAFKRQLEVGYSFIKYRTTDMNTDIVAIFYSKGDIPLGYFYQGEYHLWDEGRSKGTESIIYPPKEKRDTSYPSKYLKRTYAGVGSGHWVLENIDGGRIIKLEDGSLWEISPIDRVDTMLWLPIEDITIVETYDPVYPYKLINTDAGDEAEARLIFE